MANDNLKARVDEVIFANLNNEINALEHNPLLKELIQLLGSLQFKGIATPATNPSQLLLDTNFFYLAGPGNYPNLGNYTIDPGQAAFISYSEGEYSLDLIPITGGGEGGNTFSQQFRSIENVIWWDPAYIATAYAGQEQPTGDSFHRFTSLATSEIDVTTSRTFAELHINQAAGSVSQLRCDLELKLNVAIPNQTRLRARLIEGNSFLTDQFIDQSLNTDWVSVSIPLSTLVASDREINRYVLDLAPDSGGQFTLPVGAILDIRNVTIYDENDNEIPVLYYTGGVNSTTNYRFENGEYVHSCTMNTASTSDERLLLMRGYNASLLAHRIQGQVRATEATGLTQTEIFAEQVKTQTGGTNAIRKQSESLTLTADWQDFDITVPVPHASGFTVGFFLGLNAGTFADGNIVEFRRIVITSTSDNVRRDLGEVRGGNQEQVTVGNADYLLNWSVANSFVEGTVIVPSDLDGTRVQHLILDEAGQEPTIPATDDLRPRQEGWLATDILKGEWAFNIVDNKVWWRSNSGLILINAGGSGSTTFDALTDTPANKTGSARKIAAVNVDEDEIEYVTIDKYFVDTVRFIDLETFIYTKGKQFKITAINTGTGVTATVKLGGTDTDYTIGDNVAAFAELDITVNQVGTIEIVGELV
jgi:hypothetical protein